MIRFLRYIPAVLAIVGAIRTARKTTAAKKTNAQYKRRSTFRKP